MIFLNCYAKFGTLCIVHVVSKSTWSRLPLLVQRLSLLPVGPVGGWKWGSGAVCMCDKKLRSSVRREFNVTTNTKHIIIMLWKTNVKFVFLFFPARRQPYWFLLTCQNLQKHGFDRFTYRPHCHSLKVWLFRTLIYLKYSFSNWWKKLDSESDAFKT